MNKEVKRVVESDGNFNFLKDKWLKNYLLIYFGIAIFIVILFPIVLSQLSWGFDFTTTGPIGDTFGGIAGPIIGIIAGGFTFAAFYAQFRANQIQFNAYLEQSKEIGRQNRRYEIDKFESRFFELVNFHRENKRDFVPNTNVTIESSIIEMVDEIIFLNESILIFQESIERGTINTNEFKNVINYQIMSKNEIYNFAFKIFFLGIGNESKLTAVFNDKEKTNYSIAKCGTDHKYTFAIKSNTHMAHKLIFRLNQFGRIIDLTNEPFTGTIGYLDKIFRHLFLTVKYIADQDEKLFPRVDKLKYIDILRAQLSKDEQILIFFYGCSVFGKNWIKSDFFQNYLLIYDIPVSKFQHILNPKEVFSEKNEFGEPIYYDAG